METATVQVASGLGKFCAELWAHAGLEITHAIGRTAVDGWSELVQAVSRDRSSMQLSVL
jgi:hypothetical protein